MKWISGLLSQLNRLPEMGTYWVVIIHEKQAKNLKNLKLGHLNLKNRILKAGERLPEFLKADETLLIPGVEKKDSDILVGVLPAEPSAFHLLGFARRCLKSALVPHARNLGLVFLDSKSEADLADCFGAALATRIFLMPIYGQRLKKQKKFELQQVGVFASKSQEKNLRYGFLSGEGTNLVRSLGSLPPNELDTEIYGKKIKAFASDYGFTLKFHSKTELKRMGAGAFTAVDRGNPASKGGIYELTYSPRSSKNKKPVVLVGKGLCFDTGGYDVKTSGYMVTMKGDMMGSAVALSTLITAAKLKWPLKLKAYLGVTENHISPVAYKPDEVVTALNGMSIEVVNTDAEGRMVLADTLSLACRSKPELMIDFATLTGMAPLAIGTSYAAGFTNREAFHSKIIESGKKSGERVWTFPLDKDFGKSLESTIADTLQCTKGRSPDHILAAYFLSQFVEKDISWVHIDLSAADKEGGLAHVDSMFTGFGVRWALEFLRTKYRL